ncbi:MAG: aminomethyl-transferring glycine dehydrogenase subunit GcvPA [Chloroflexi bacterium]|nr:aminomethyl-transferring glycine dehydrogenase subunit GcvPA [Chloroflexota bacterium]
MLDAIGVADFEDLVADVPEAYRHPTLDLPPAAHEMSLASEMAALASTNYIPGDYACFLGSGAYRHYIPAVARKVANRGEFMTSYTPYQPEVAQGSLQVAFEFQTMVSHLMGLEVANAGMYDGPTAFAEAALMAARITKRNKVVALDTVDERNIEVLRSYSHYQGIEIVRASSADLTVPNDAACVMVQSPNVYGVIEDMGAVSDAAHAQGALAVASVNPMSLGMFKSPGECDIDIATGEGQSIGVPLGFGGPYVGLFTCKDSYKRQMPGRIVGKTTDTNGETGYVLTLQTREQHIRRERATSNICTSTQLIALMVAAYLATLGKQGLRETAELCYQKAHYAASQINALPGYSLVSDGTFFNEFAVSCPKSSQSILDALIQRKIIGGADVSNRVPNGIVFALTEQNTRAEIDRLIEALDEIGSMS